MWSALMVSLAWLAAGLLVARCMGLNNEKDES